ncbi:hypothetical protein SDC9_54330 [bioreactor metagenome]|uniref:Uncharacterized protein n=1 Tax=bioreactor metagenome TaxID=1076179 RepID=A0A644WX10_9ZZZZ
MVQSEIIYIIEGLLSKLNCDTAYSNTEASCKIYSGSKVESIIGPFLNEYGSGLNITQFKNTSFFRFVQTNGYETVITMINSELIRKEIFDKGTNTLYSYDYKNDIIKSEVFDKQESISMSDEEIQQINYAFSSGNLT